MSTDSRTYVDRIFFNYEGDRLVPKPATIIDYTNGGDLPKDQILILENYKAAKGRGRKDHLEGKTVMVFSTEKTQLFIPLDEGLKLASYIHSYLTSFFRIYNQPTNPVERIVENENT